MGNLIVVIKFYLLVWWKNGSIVENFLIPNIIAIIFYLDGNKWGWVMVFPIFGILIQLFFLDSNQIFDLFFKINNVDIFIRHYAKILLLTIMTTIVMLDVRLMFILSGNNLLLNYSLDYMIFTIGVESSLLLFFYKAKNLIKTIVIFVGVSAGSILFTYYLSNFFSVLSPFLLIFILLHSIIYYLYAVRRVI